MCARSPRARGQRFFVRGLADVARRAGACRGEGGRGRRDQGRGARARGGGQGVGAKAGTGEGVLRRVLGKADAIDASNYKLLRRFPDVLFPVVAQDPREAEEPGERVVRRVADHRRRVRPLAPAGCRLVL